MLLEKRFGDRIRQRFASASQYEVPVRLPQQLEPDKLIGLLRETFQFRSGNAVARSQCERDPLGAFHFVREVFGGFMRRLTRKQTLNVGAIIADILPTLGTNS